MGLHKRLIFLKRDRAYLWDESWKNKSTPYSTVLRNIVRQNKPTKVHMNRDLLPEVPEIVIIRYNIHVCWVKNPVADNGSKRF